MTRFGNLRWSLRGSSQKRAGRRKLRNLLMESLESRALLAGDVGFSSALLNEVRQPGGAIENPQLLTPPDTRIAQIQDARLQNGARQTEVATHEYFVDGKAQGMVIYPDRIALGLKQGLMGPQNTQWAQAFGLTEMRPLNGTFSVYSSNQPITEELLGQLNESGFVETVVPVFKMLESQSEAVLLNEVIVKLPEGVSPEDYFANERFSGYQRLAGTPDQFVATLAAGYGEVALAEINQLSKDRSIDWAAPNFHQKWQKFFTPNDPRFTNLWHLNNTGQSAGGPNAVPGLAGADVSITDAWAIKQGSNSSIVVGVLDDGVPAPFIAGATDHPDLLNYVGDANYGAGPDTNSNGWLGDRNGWNFVNNGFISWPSTVDDAHGTAVAGIAAARGNNGVGVVGAAYGSPVLSARMFDGAGVATDAQIASALYYLAGRTFDGLGQWSASTVVNHSWGGGAVSAAINTALTWATTSARGGLGVAQFWSSGNGGAAIGYPASQAATTPGIVVVGASNNAGELSSYHAIGAVLDIVAPSNEFVVGPGNEQIYLAIDTTDRRAAAGYDPTDYTGTGANGFGGTSASAPLAAGVGALAMARAADLGINLTANQLRSLMRNNTDLIGGVAYSTTNNGHSNLGGKGLINAGSLLKGIGAAQMSVHTSLAEVTNGSDGWTFGTVFEDSISEAIFRIRSQGTQTLNITSISISGDASYTVTGPVQSSLGLGEGTTFTVRFNPTSPGTKVATVTILSNDPTNPSLSFELSSEVEVPDANGFAFEDRNGDGVKQSGENALAGRTAFLDTNSNGIFDTFATPSFTNSTPLTIPSTAAVTLTSTINVAGLTNFITDVNVTLNVTHTWVSDLAFVLEAPNGDFSILFNQRGGSADNLINTVLDDSAASPISAGVAPFTGSFRPETPLSIFNGLSAADANGTWTLTVFDFFPEDGGSLNNWTINFGTGEANAQSDAFGFFAFDGIPNGSYTARLVADANWTAPAGAPVSYPVVIPPGEAHGLNFALGRNNRLYANVFDDTNGNGVQNAGENGRSGRTLFLDGNLNGVLDGNVDTNVSGSPGTVIPDNTTVNVPINVAGVAGLIQDLDVTLNISHTWVSDISIRLISPGGTDVLLFNRRGGSGDNLVNTVFDDAAAASITAGTAPFTGSWRPEQPLSVLNGTSANGTWTLRIQDFATDDPGLLNSFNLKFTTSPDTAFVTGADGWATFDLPAGPHDVVLTDAGWNFTVPANGKRSVNASGAPLFNQTYGERDVIPAIIVGTSVTHVGYTGAGSPIDTGKSLAKESASPTLLSYNNLINSVGGIRGLLFDVQDLAGTVTASDFVFQMSPTGAFDASLPANQPANWASAPAPAVVLVNPIGSNDRISVLFNAGSIQNRWLRITVLANANTGLTTPEVYYVGHLLGETTGPSGLVFTVAFADITPIRSAAGNVVDASSTVDIDKNGTVSFADISAMRSNVGSQLTIFSIPAAGGAELLNGFDGGRGKGSGRSEGVASPLVDSNSLNVGASFDSLQNVKAPPASKLLVERNSTVPSGVSQGVASRDAVFGQLDRSSGSARRVDNMSASSSGSSQQSFFEQLSEGASLEEALASRK